MIDISRSMITCLILAITACGSGELLTDSGLITSSPDPASTSSSSSTSTDPGDATAGGDVSTSTGATSTSSEEPTGGATTSGSSSSTGANGSTDVSTSSTGADSADASTASVPSTSSSTSTSTGSSTGDPAQACFGALCSDELPCGDGLVCLVHPYGGPAVCGLADCIPGEYCEGDEYACSKHTPQGECIKDNSGHGWCHPRACKDGWYCETGECDAGLCYPEGA